MKKIKCKKLGNVISISLNNEYEILNESETRYTLINDKGIQKNYCKSLFDIIPEEEPVFEPIVVIPVIEEFEIVTNIDENNPENSIYFKVDIQFTPNFIFSKKINQLNYSGSNISCGVKQIYNIDGFIMEINNLKSGIQEYINNNVNNFTLPDDFNIDEIILDIVRSLIQDMIGYFQDEDSYVNTGIVIMSTTQNSINECIILKESLNEVSTVIEAFNPNSGNMITMWSIIINE